MTAAADGARRKPAVAPGHARAALLLLIVTLAARIAVLGNPVVGFDEQFYLLVGDRMLHGALPYVDIFDRKPVGLFLIYAGARLLGGDGFVQYKLVAAAFVAATAYLVYRTARRHVAWTGAVLSGVLYVLWLDFMEGEGGQTPVFYNLFIAGAGALLLAAVPQARGLMLRGSLALLLVGLALQIKSSTVFEGVYFGCAFLVLAWRHRLPWPRATLFAALMVLLALLPTVLVASFYLAVGHWQEFLFCNVLSVFGQGKAGVVKQIAGLAGLVGIFLPLIVMGSIGRRGAAAAAEPIERRFLLGWLVAAVLGVLVYWRFNSPHYAMPVLVPTCLAIAPALATRRRVATGLALTALLAGQIVLALNTALKGGAREAHALAALAMPRARCIFVYNAYPALYMLTHSCLPSRWAFPGHLNVADENNPRALGADPLAITHAILARRPDAIVDTWPVFAYGNTAVHAIVRREIRARYELAGCVVTSLGKVRIVYRPRGDGGPRARGTCPAALLPGIE